MRLINFGRYSNTTGHHQTMENVREELSRTLRDRSPSYCGTTTRAVESPHICTMSGSWINQVDPPEMPESRPGWNKGTCKMQKIESEFETHYFLPLQWGSVPFPLHVQTPT